MDRAISCFKGGCLDNPSPPGYRIWENRRKENQGRQEDEKGTVKGKRGFRDLEYIVHMGEWFIYVYTTVVYMYNTGLVTLETGIPKQPPNLIIIVGGGRQHE